MSLTLRLNVLASLVRNHLSDFVESHVPIGGLQMSCMLTSDISEQAAVDAARHVGIQMLGLSALHAAGSDRAGFLMGFAAYTSEELEIAVIKLANAFRAIETHGH